MPRSGEMIVAVDFISKAPESASMLGVMKNFCWHIPLYGTLFFTKDIMFDVGCCKMEFLSLLIYGNNTYVVSALRNIVALHFSSHVQKTRF